MAINLMYIIYNQDGSIKEKNFPNYVNQGSSNVNRIFVAIDGEDNTDYSVSGVFKLPNNDTSSVAFLQGSEKLHEEDEENTSGYYYDLTEAQTYYAGILLLSINAIYTLTQNLFTYTAKITVNSTTYEAESDNSDITNGQYNSLIAALNGKLERYNAGNVRCYSSLTDANNDLDNLVNNEIILVRAENNKAVRTYFCSDSGLAKSLHLLRESIPLVYITNTTTFTELFELLGLTNPTQQNYCSFQLNNNFYLMSWYYQGSYNGNIMSTSGDLYKFKYASSSTAIYSLIINSNLCSNVVYRTLEVSPSMTLSQFYIQMGLVGANKIGFVNLSISGYQTVIVGGSYIFGIGSSFESGNQKTYYEVEKIGTAFRWQVDEATGSNLQIGDFLMDPTYRADYLTNADVYTKTETDTLLNAKEDVSNKTTTLSSDSTDTQYPSAKCVYDNIKNVIEIAEGKTDTYVIHSNLTIEVAKQLITQYSSTIYGKMYLYNSTTKEWDDITEDFINGDYDSIVLKNSAFNSQNTGVGFTDYLIAGETSMGGTFYMFNCSVGTTPLKVGDIIYVSDNGVPDRWVSQIGYPTIFTSFESSQSTVKWYKHLFSMGFQAGTYYFELLSQTQGKFATLLDLYNAIKETPFIVKLKRIEQSDNEYHNLLNYSNGGGGTIVSFRILEGTTITTLTNSSSTQIPDGGYTVSRYYIGD